MLIARSIKQLRKYLDRERKRGKTIGFVPTMGYLHEGHLSLVRRAEKECDIVVASIYVNPKQFSPHEDLSRYPRNLSGDKKLLEKENTDILFYPSDRIMYSKDFETYIDVGNLSRGLCGESRPEHFRGVATVVAKLFGLVGPDTAYFGKKDYQQVLVIKTMVRDLNIPVKIAACSTVREADGLAMSSRNVFLTPKERREAVWLSRALRAARQDIIGGERQTSVIEKEIRSLIKRRTSGRVDYAETRDAETLMRYPRLRRGRYVIALAVKFSKARLIDNVEFRIP